MDLAWCIIEVSCMLTQVKWPTQMEDTSAHVASLEGSFPELSECLFSICGSQVQVQLNACSPLNRLQQVAIRLVPFSNF